MRRVQVVKIHHPDRRKGPDRRVDMRRSRLYFPTTERSWLAFESGTDRRRLRPVPERWWLEDDAGLERLCALARPQSTAGARPAETVANRERNDLIPG
jgi:hypothetical protein